VHRRLNLAVRGLLGESLASQVRLGVLLYGVVVTLAFPLALAFGRLGSPFSYASLTAAIAVTLSALALGVRRRSRPQALLQLFSLGPALTLGLLALAMSANTFVILPLVALCAAWSALFLPRRQVAVAVFGSALTSFVPFIRALLTGQSRTLEVLAAAGVRVATVGLLAVAVHGLAQEMRRSRQALGLERDRSSALLEVMADGIVRIGPCGELIDVNERFCRLTGFERGELIGAREPYPFWPSTSFDRLRNLASGNGERDVDHKVHRKDGSVLPAVLAIACLRDERGTALEYVVTIKDVSERRALAAERDAALAAAQRSHELLEGAAAAVRTYFYVAEVSEGTYTPIYHGPGLAALLGVKKLPRDRHELARLWRSAIHEEDRELYHEMLVVQPGQLVRAEYRLVGCDGVTRWVLHSQRPEVTPEGMLVYGSVDDVTARVQAEQDLEAAHNALARQVHELTELDRMKDDFVALVSHELRTPLTSIEGYLDLVLEDDEMPQDEQRRFLETVRRNSDRLVRLVNDLLVLFRADGGRLELDLSELNLRDLVLESVAHALPAAERAGVALSASLETVPTVLGDETRLSQVLDNLISNAVKYTPLGGAAEVRITTGAEFIEIAVEDSGIGIPAEEQGRLFERFFRSSLASALQIQGSGLGLAITREMVEAHGGTLEVRSVEGEGSCFTVRLPVAQPAALADAA
jgi:PAS domain S-box-containing protein